MRNYKLLMAAALSTTLLCQGVVSTAYAETDQEREACTNDAQTLCGPAIPDRDRVYACMVQRVRQLSPACQVVIKKSIAANKRKR